MTESIFGPLAEGFRDGLRLFVALFLAPVGVLSAFVRHADPRKPPSGDRARTLGA
jgi:hypothetical protein